MAPRGTATAAHSKLPTAVLTRDTKAPRGRGAAANTGYRPPLLAVTHESYDDYVSPILFAQMGKSVWLKCVQIRLSLIPLDGLGMSAGFYGDGGLTGA